jgi:hypothetical protein
MCPFIGRLHVFWSRLARGRVKTARAMLPRSFRALRNRISRLAESGDATVGRHDRGGAADPLAMSWSSKEGSKAVIGGMLLSRSDTPVTLPAIVPDGDGGFAPCPELMTKNELIRFLRIPEISKSQDYDNVVDNLVGMHGLPCIHLCRQPLFPLEAIRRWIHDKVQQERRA